MYMHFNNLYHSQFFWKAKRILNQIDFLHTSLSIVNYLFMPMYIIFVVIKSVDLMDKHMVYTTLCF